MTKLIQESTLTAIGNAIRAKIGSAELMSPSAMATAIAGIETGGGDMPAEALNITGDCRYRFASTGWDWFVTRYGDRITTSGITDAFYMFNSSKLSEIPFEINLKENENVDCNDIFSYIKIVRAPYIIGSPSRISRCFAYCYDLKEIPEDWADKIDWNYMQINGGLNSFFQECYSLRKIPASLMTRFHSDVKYSYISPHNGAFRNCVSLDEITGIGICWGAATSNLFSDCFSGVCRAKDITFAVKSSGVYTANWQNQTIDLSNCVGHAQGISSTLKDEIINRDNGITEADEVVDDASYAALKDTDNWWTKNIAYSRYNHDSAVRTLQSLPNNFHSSGGNVIKFKGESGSATDGGAINTLTEEEIAVATAKGWTVTLV